MTDAIFSVGGQQFKAEPGLIVRVPLLEAEPCAKVTFDQVLLTSDGKDVTTGTPTGMCISFGLVTQSDGVTSR